MTCHREVLGIDVTVSDTCLSSMHRSLYIEYMECHVLLGASSVLPTSMSVPTGHRAQVKRHSGQIDLMPGKISIDLTFTECLPILEARTRQARRLPDRGQG